MAGASYRHFEVLGPRADLDAWLASVQDAGVCHLADALDELEGHAGIGRPELRAEEVHADLLRSEASRALRGVERVLPATPHQRGNERRPLWSLGPGAVGEQELHALKDEARAIATALGVALEQVHVCETRVTHLDALAAARTLLKSADAGTAAAAAPSSGGAHVFSLPRTSGRRRASSKRRASGKRQARRLQRRLRKMVAGEAGRPLRGAGERSYVVVLPCLAGSAPTPGIAAAAAAQGAEVLTLSQAGDASAEGAALLEARGLETEARATLRSEVAATGERGRFLLDSLEDADRRSRARRQLASSEYVTAARVYVRPEDESILRERLHAAHGESVVLRPLAERGDAPSRPRRIAAAPFAVFDALLPGRFGEVPSAALLALFTPLAVGLVWADVAGGVFLLLAGALLGSGAGAGSPRRDTALLAQVGGLLSLVLGVLFGRAFGPAGAAWFGTDWGLGGWGTAGGGDAGALLMAAGFEPAWAGPFVGVAWLLGAVAALAALWGLCLALSARARGQAARSRTAGLGALHYVVVAGLAAALLPAGHALAWAWVLAPAGALAVLVLGGPRRFLLQLCLDLVGVLRLVAVAGAALLIFDLVLASWVAPAGVALGFEVILIGALALIVAALAVVADPAHLAMGVPYDLALGGTRLGRPFEPFRRRLRRRDERVEEASDGG